MKTHAQQIKERNERDAVRLETKELTPRQYDDLRQAYYKVAEGLEALTEALEIAADNGNRKRLDDFFGAACKARTDFYERMKALGGVL
jgi:hypothetical protein